VRALKVRHAFLSQLAQGVVDGPQTVLPKLRMEPKGKKRNDFEQIREMCGGQDRQIALRHQEEEPP
jgi:hypothetical protein